MVLTSPPEQSKEYEAPQVVLEEEEQEEVAEGVPQGVHEKGVEEVALEVGIGELGPVGPEQAVPPQRATAGSMLVSTGAESVAVAGKAASVPDSDIELQPSWPS